MRPLFPLLLLAVLAGVVASCGDSIQYAEPPARAAAANDPHSENPHGPAGQPGMPAGHPPVAGTPAPAGGTPPAAGGADPFEEAADAHKPVSESGATIDPQKLFYRGRVEIDPAFVPPSSFAIYVCAGLPPKGSPPAFSKRFDKPSFPLDFELLGKDLAFGDTKVDEPLVLYLIFSEAGYVMAKTGIYFKTPAGAPIPIGSSDVVLTLKKP